MGIRIEKASFGVHECRKAARRLSILDIAQQSFLEQGYDRTTMSGIAEAMGGSKGTLWNYFDSKESLFEAVIERAADSFRSDLMDTLKPRGKPETALRRFAESFIRKTTSPDAIALQRIIIGESPRFPELGRIFYARASGVMGELLASYMVTQMETGALRKGEPMKAVGMFLSLCDGGHHKRVLWGVEKYNDTMTKEDAVMAVGHFLSVYGSR